MRKAATLFLIIAAIVASVFFLSQRLALFPVREIARVPSNGGGIHTTEFKTTYLHGVEFFRDKKGCANCHGFSFDGGSSKVSCASCHDYPHPVKWALPENHGATYRKRGVEEGGACLNCHGEGSKFKERNPKIFVACNSCHEAFPHGDLETFLEKHTDDAGIAKTYKGQCTLCHKVLGATLSKNKEITEVVEHGCYSCHDEPEKPVAGWDK